MTRRRSISRSKPVVPAAVAFVAMLIGAAPAFAGNRLCDGVGSLRSGAAKATSTIEVTNHRSTPSTVELVDGSGAIADQFTLAPGENRLLQTYRTGAWISRDGRRRCLSRFVSEQESERWEITSTLDGDYDRKNVRSFPVYVAPEFGSHDSSLLQRCLEVLDSDAKRIEEVIPAAAWHRISRVPIWLEYEPDSSYEGAYFSSPQWLAENGISIAKASSIQFTSSLAAMPGYRPNLLMHELAHAYHDLVLSYSDTRIHAAFERARASGLYNAARHSSGRLERAYAMRNPMEFFAELSEAYFGTNDVFPFTRDDLKAFDPSSYRAIVEAWERSSERTSTWPVSPDVRSR